mmetsp:Transcript_3651/g.7987  ORF Transcript_3651/g.7987 Transcript_3651/m.7987 type:complete len:628 (-) Transcript_3651:83-1966(-)
MASSTSFEDNIITSSLLLQDGGENNTHDETVETENPLSRVPPSAIWNNSVNINNINNSGVGNHHGSPLGEDDRMALLRMPPPLSNGFDDDDDEGNNGYGYGFANAEEKKDGSSDGRFANAIHNSPLHAPNGSPSHINNNNVATASSSVFRLTRSLPSTSLLMKRLGHIFAISSTAIFLLVVFPLFCRLAIFDARRGRTDYAAFYSAAAFVVITLVLSIREILSHLYNWYAPQVQKFVVRILFMVPLYSVQSWLSLRFHGPARVYIDTVRDLYEAYVIQSFVYYLIELLGGEDRMAELLSRKDARLGGHGRIMSKCLKRWVMGKDFLVKIKQGVLQYVVIKTILSLLTTFVFLPSKWYGEGTFDLNYAYVYITTIMNTSVMYALYCLVKLFHAVKSDLRSPVNWHPVGKFLCVKGVVFFTWWQGVFIYFLRSHEFIGDVGSWSGDEVAGGIIDYLICVEMVFFSIGHMFTFTYKEYLPEGMEERKKSGIVGWLFEGVDKRRRTTNHDTSGNPDGNYNGNQPPTLQSALLEGEEDVTPCIDENGNIAESSYYRAPRTSSGSGFDKLEDPLSLREAFWSSTVPSETLDDIKRFGVVSGGPGSTFGLGQGGGNVTGGIDISLTSMNNAESI